MTENRLHQPLVSQLSNSSIASRTKKSSLHSPFWAGGYPIRWRHVNLALAYVALAYGQAAFVSHLISHFI